MGVLSTLFGTGDIISKGMDLIDSKFPTDIDKIEAKTKAKTDLLTSYAPFKVAQRYLALLFGITFVGSFWLVMFMTLKDSSNPVESVSTVLADFKIGWIMLTIIGFYFGGGAFEGVVGKVKEKKQS